MAQDNIEERIKGRFEATKRLDTTSQRIVFWMDETGEFKDSIDSLDLGDIKILKLDRYNSFKVKYILEHDDLESRHLVYVPYSLPKDENNILADMIHYTNPPFCADKPSLLCEDLRIDIKNVDVVKRHIKFLNSNERRRKYLNYDVDGKNPDSIVLGIMATVMNSDASDFKQILMDVLRSFSEDTESGIESTALDGFETYDLTEPFWEQCKKEFGIEDQTIGALVRIFFISYASCKIQLDPNKMIAPHISSKSGKITTFINEMYNNSNYSESAEFLSDWVADKMKLDLYFDSFDLKALGDSDAFRCIDEIIINRLIGQMSSTCKPLDASDVALLHKRETLHYYNDYESQYNAILFGHDLLDNTLNFSLDLSATKNPADIIDNYASKWYCIDRCYRGFVFNTDKIEEKTPDMERFIDFIENTYNNKFLNEISERLSSMVESYADLPGVKQTGFYDKYVEKTDQATVVIISDAFRYECATELREVLDKSSRVKEQKLDHIISTLPSITKFGMAALLPNNGLEVCPGDNYSVRIDGMNTNMDDREVVLKARNPASVVLKYKDAISMKTQDLRDACKGKRVVYIYHDIIDATGDKPQNEMRTFVACRDAVDEIRRLIEIVTNRLSYTRFIVTSDHGFIYRRKKIEELDKILLPSHASAEKRYILSDVSCDFIQTQELSLDYLGVENGEFYVSVPTTSGIFKVPGAGQNFVHGGMSPQEIVVPVLEVHTNKGKVKEEYVGLKAVSKPTIKKSKPNLGFWQENPVFDKYREATYELWFENEDGQRVSDVQSIIANKVVGQEMEHHVRFTLSMNKGTAYLNIKNKTDDDVPTVKEEYQVQIMFTDLGGF